MTLIHVNRFAKAFAQEAKTEGYPLFARGQVRLLGDNDVRVQFRVADEVDCHFEIRSKMLKLGCTCAEAQQGTLCRHLWSGFSFLEETRCLFSQNLRFATDVELDQAHFNLPITDPVDLDATSIDADTTEARSDKARRLAYVIAVTSFNRLHHAFVERVVQNSNGKGAWRIDANADSAAELDAIGTDLDRELATVFADAPDEAGADLPLFAESQAARITVGSTAFAEAIAPLVGTQRLFIDVQGRMVRMSRGAPATPRIILRPADDQRFSCKLDLNVDGEIAAILDNGLLLVSSTWHLFEIASPALAELLRSVRARGAAATDDLERLLSRLHPEDFRRTVDIGLEQIETPPPIPVLELGPHRLWQPRHRLGATVRIAYGKREMPIANLPLIHVDLAANAWFERNCTVEAESLDSFLAHKGIGRENLSGDIYVQNKNVEQLLSQLEMAGWRIRWSGRAIAGNAKVELDIRMHADEIDVDGCVSYGDVRVPLIDVVAQWQANRSFLDLGNGCLGAFPSSWLSANESLMSVATASDQSIVFNKSYAGVVQSLRESADKAQCDPEFQNVTTRLLNVGRGQFTPPPGFTGQLRPYQTDGVSWLLHLRELGFGGLLADDMGLGKTIQTLAYLETRRGQGLSLIVVPRSLLGNWRREAARFTPELRVHIHHGQGRSCDAVDLAEFDVIVTTYGTMRNDINMLASVELDACILDEAQAIKNRWSQSSAAIHRISAHHRIALTGTPVQNHVREIANIFDFLNPHVLPNSRTLRSVLHSKHDPAPDQIDLFAKSISPFMLRRLKEQVETDLPPKTVQDVTCELDGDHFDAYQQLLEEVRTGVRARVRADGWGPSKIHVFEAMTRLRMCACHPALGGGDGGDSNKIDLLVEMLAEVVESGRKALVFSQFTTLLALVKKRLDEEEISFEYLDGKTHDRDRRVAHFLDDPFCPVFLVSLHAGGVGLNLTAAEYVFILDPWWNPAVEQQAIDRTHRIGQDKPVFVYRIIAAGTIEERVLRIQAEKQLLMDDVLGNAASVARDIDESDLDLLLS